MYLYIFIIQSVCTYFILLFSLNVPLLYFVTRTLFRFNLRSDVDSVRKQYPIRNLWGGKKIRSVLAVYSEMMFAERITLLLDRNGQTIVVGTDFQRKKPKNYDSERVITGYLPI